jgi:hypothetical protein
MKKIMKIVVILMVVSSFLNAKLFNPKIFRQGLKHYPITSIGKKVSKLETSKNLEKFVKTIHFKKLTPIDKMTEVAKQIANKGPFANKLMASKNPIYAMELYSKYGDKFLKTSKIVTSKVAEINPKILEKLSRKYPNLKNISKFNKDEIIDRFVYIMKATGRAGVTITQNIGKFAIKHPKSALIGVMYGWFLTDPQGFKEELDKFGGSVEEFASHLGSLAGDVVVGGTTGFFSSLYDTTMTHLTLKNVLILILFLIIYLLWKFRELLINLINQIVSKKINSINSEKPKSSLESKTTKNNKNRRSF